jgi:hypothetical protein
MFTTLKKMSERKKVYYLASPYSHADHNVRVARFERVNYVAYKLMETYGFALIEPIVTGHPKVAFGLPTNFQFWQANNHALIDRADGIIVFMDDDWKDSKGVLDEINYAVESGKEVLYLNKNIKFDPSVVVDV